MDYQKIIKKIRSIHNNQEGFVPLQEPAFGELEKKYLNECIDSSVVSTVGDFVNQFEDSIAKYTGSKFAIACVNGTSALQLSLRLAGVKKDDEVLTQPLSFVATANAILYNNAHPVFVDVDLDTIGMSPKSLLEFLEKNTEIIDDACFNKITKRKIKACMPMHTFGHACRISEIVEICNQFKINVVEDSAQALGSRLNGQHLGNFGLISAISLNGNKIITTGGGGIILTNNEEIAIKAKHLSTQAKVKHKWEYFHDDLGYNFRMPNLNAALGLAQLEKLDEVLESKRKLAEIYDEFFIQEGINFFKDRDEEKSNYWLNALIFNNIEDRETFLQKTYEANIMTRPIWTLMNKLPKFKNCLSTDLNNANWLEKRVVNIPSSVK